MMLRGQNPRRDWLVDHLADVYTAVVVTLILGVLVGHLVTTAVSP